MAERIVLHVGTMKSGTTSMQALLFAGRDVLARQGIRAPGESWEEQVRAVRDVLATGDGSGETWRRLASEATAWAGTSVYSMEYLGTFGAGQATAVAASFGETPVEVVITFRDLNRTLASMWQETIQNGRDWSWHGFLRGARAERPGQGRIERLLRRVARRLGWSRPAPAGRNFWLQHDVLRIARLWASVVGEEHVTLVAVPGPGSAPDALTARFGQVVGFDPATVPATPRDNSSLGAASVQVLRELNVRLRAAGVAWDDGRDVRKFLLAKEILRRRTAGERRIGLAVAGWVRAESAWRETQLRASRMRFVGDWSELLPVEVAGVDPSQTTAPELVEVARAAFEGLLEARGLAGAWPGAEDPQAALDALAGLVLQEIRR